MDILETILPEKLFQILERNGLSSLKQVINLSTWDIKKLTNLSTDDIKLIKTKISESIQPKCLTCDLLLLEKVERVSTGCNGINNILKGGFRRGTVTEIYGESGSGKTQIAIQATVCNWANGCVYICTEDLFPIKRYEQIKKNIPCYDSNVNYGKNTFVEHVTESSDFISCIRVRLPKLLLQNKIALIVIDSIAAPFRVESTDYIKRAQELKELANLLITFAIKHNLAILCINQVTAAFTETVDEVMPALGLAWSNMIDTRLWLKKNYTEVVDISYDNMIEKSDYSFRVRELSVELSPELPSLRTQFIITPMGIKDI